MDIKGTYTTRSKLADDLKELDFSVSSGSRAIEDIARNVDQLAELHTNLETGREELEEVCVFVNKLKLNLLIKEVPMRVFLRGGGHH